MRSRTSRSVSMIVLSLSGVRRSIGIEQLMESRAGAE